MRSTQRATLGVTKCESPSRHGGLFCFPEASITPQPRQADESDGVQFDSSRTCTDQLIHYKTYGNGRDTPTH